MRAWHGAAAILRHLGLWEMQKRPTPHALTLILFHE